MEPGSFSTPVSIIPDDGLRRAETWHSKYHDRKVMMKNLQIRHDPYSLSIDLSMGKTHALHMSSQNNEQAYDWNLPWR